MRFTTIDQHVKEPRACRKSHPHDGFGGHHFESRHAPDPAPVVDGQVHESRLHRVAERHLVGCGSSRWRRLTLRRRPLAVRRHNELVLGARIARGDLRDVVVRIGRRRRRLAAPPHRDTHPGLRAPADYERRPIGHRTTHQRHPTACQGSSGNVCRDRQPIGAGPRMLRGNDQPRCRRSRHVRIDRTACVVSVTNQRDSLHSRIVGQVDRDAGERPGSRIDLAVEGEFDHVCGQRHVEPLHDPRRLRLAAHRNAGPGPVAPVAAIQRPLVVGRVRRRHRLRPPGHDRLKRISLAGPQERIPSR